MMKKVFITALAVMAALSAMAQQGTAEPRHTLELTLAHSLEFALTDHPPLQVAHLAL